MSETGLPPGQPTNCETPIKKAAKIHPITVAVALGGVLGLCHKIDQWWVASIGAAIISGTAAVGEYWIAQLREGGFRSCCRAALVVFLICAPPFTVVMLDGFYPITRATRLQEQLIEDIKEYEKRLGIDEIPKRLGQPPSDQHAQSGADQPTQYR